MCQGDIQFFCGEVKYITATVRTTNPNETVVVSEAKYELSDSQRNVVEQGDCEAEKSEIRLLLGIDTQGYYTLKITVKIGRETVIQKAGITVWE